MERGWHVMILLSTSTLFIPFRQHLLQYVSGKPGPTRMGQSTSQLSSARCPDDNFVTWQMCFGWTSAVCIGIQHGQHLPGGRDQGGGGRLGTWNWKLSITQSAHICGFHPLSKPLCMPPLTPASSPSPQIADCGSPGRPTAHQSWFPNKWTQENEKQRHNH